MTGKYEARVNLSNENSSHSLIVELTGHDKRVLDVGTATGYVAEALAARGCTVIGIELNPEAAERAEEHCEKVVVGDVETLGLEEKLERGSFDTIVFGDVLEHLKDPKRTLERVAPLLSPEGYVVASIPNVAHGSVRLALLQGRFRYTQLGLLDETHLKFFTRESVEELFSDAGYAIAVMERTTQGIFDTEIEIDRESIPEGALQEIRKDPESETYQFVLTAYPAGGSPVAAKLNHLRLLEERLAHRDRLIYELNREVRNVGELQRRLDDRDRRLAEKEEEVSKLSHELAVCNNRLARMENRRASRPEARLQQPRREGA